MQTICGSLTQKEICYRTKDFGYAPASDIFLAAPPKRRVEHKSISRKHLTITVDPVERGDGTQIYNRSRVTIEDHGSKFGSLLNGEKLRSDSAVLDNKSSEHNIKLGNYEKKVRITWNPIVLSHSLSKKEGKKDDPLGSFRSRLEPHDIKSIVPYVFGTTTHVIATKRNTAKGLQALINGKYLVEESYVNAIIKATEPCDTADPESSSLLEGDFDANWPDASRFLPPPGNEPTKRPVECFEPSLDRSDIFCGYTFIFFDVVQYENLGPPINNGGGKTQIFELKLGITTSDDLFRFAKSVADESDDGPFADGCEGKGVVLVRFKTNEKWFEWAKEISHEVSQRLDHRMIEQSEFLDAILANDASLLRKPLREAGEGITRTSAHLPTRGIPAVFSRTHLTGTVVLISREASDTLMQHISSSGARTSQSYPATVRPPVIPSRLRGPIVSKFKGYDDSDDDDDQPVKPKRSLPDRDDPSDEVESPSDREVSRNRAGQKRGAPEEQSQDDEAFLDQLLPGAAAMKRRRLMLSASPPPLPVEPSVTSKPMQKVKKELDVIAAARSRREEEDAAAASRQVQEFLSLGGVDIGKLRDLAIIELMEVPNRRRQGNGLRKEIENEERWAGRKNFKKFRRHRAEDGSQTKGSRVIIPLQEALRNEFGLSDELWMTSSLKGPSGTNGKSRKVQALADKEDDSQPLFVPQSQEYATAEEHIRSDDDDNEMLRPQIGKQGKERAKATAAKKRGASQTFTKPPVPKKQRKLAVQASKDSSDESEDEFRFKFKRAL
ncbi:MAG: hypothetical protein M1814_000302 [Vezdaea aestivalis]|nr:MAG: hypothetical protein M1814_000302 [Vezdaea aestivalis]